MEKDTKLFEEIRDESKQRLVDYQPRDALFKEIYEMRHRPLVAL